MVDLLREYTSLLEKDFRSDLEALLTQKEDVLKQLGAFLAQNRDAHKLNRTSTWIPLARATGEPVDKLRKLYMPCQYLAGICAREGVDMRELLGTLSTADALPAVEGDTVALLDGLCSPLVDVYREAQEYLRDTPPFLHMDRVESHTLAMADFKSGFTPLEDDPSTYEPAIKRIWPMVAVDILLSDPLTQDTRDTVTIGLSERDLDFVIAKLQLAKRELSVLKDALVKENNADGRDEH